jgi:DNA-binding LacI/PurR family transcriptional regulator
MENKNKIEGYIKALREAGIPVRENFLIEEENTIEGGYVATRKLLGLKKRPRAIFATSDLLAFGVIDALRDEELHIPEEVAVMGFDNIRISNLMVPKLSTVAKPLHKMGLSGARLLLDVIESGEDGDLIVKEIILQSKLKIRKSCGHKERIKEIF